MAKLGFKPSLSLVMEVVFTFFFCCCYQELSLFGNSRGIVIWEMHAVASYRPVLWGVGTIFIGKERQQKRMFNWSLSSKLVGERFLADILWLGGKSWSSVNQAFTEMSLLVLKFHFFWGSMYEILPLRRTVLRYLVPWRREVASGFHWAHLNRKWRLSVTLLCRG